MRVGGALGNDDGLMDGATDGGALGFKVGPDGRIVVGADGIAEGFDDGASGIST